MINKAQLATHNIANKGFSGIQRFVARFNFSCNRIGNCPQSLTGHIVNRYQSSYLIPQQMNIKENKKVIFPVFDGMIICNYQNIVRVEALGKYSIAYLFNKNDPIKILKSICEIWRMLAEFNIFFQCHRSHIINTQFIDKYITKMNIIVTPKGNVPISRRKSKEFLNIICS